MIMDTFTLLSQYLHFAVRSTIFICSQIIGDNAKKFWHKNLSNNLAGGLDSRPITGFWMSIIAGGGGEQMKRDQLFGKKLF